MATGKIGSVVLYRAFGEERARSWVAGKRNPKTWRQSVQRAIMKTAHVSYSTLIQLCRQSFQGFEAGTPCQAQFISRACRDLRALIAADIDGGMSSVLECSVGNFNGIKDEEFLINRLMVSNGGLSPMGATASRSGLMMPATGDALKKSQITYRDVCRAYSLEEGDALHLVFGEFDPAKGVCTLFHYAKVVLRPSTGDMDALFCLESGAAVNLPNEGNIGSVSVFWSDEEDQADSQFTFQLPSYIGTGVRIYAGAVVRSHQYGSLLQWSPEYLAVSDTTMAGNNAASLGLAVASYMNGRDVYLNGM